MRKKQTLKYFLCLTFFIFFQKNLSLYSNDFIQNKINKYIAETIILEKNFDLNGNFQFVENKKINKENQKYIKENHKDLKKILQNNKNIKNIDLYKKIIDKNFKKLDKYNFESLNDEILLYMSFLSLRSNKINEAKNLFEQFEKNLNYINKEESIILIAGIVSYELDLLKNSKDYFTTLYSLSQTTSFKKIALFYLINLNLESKNQEEAKNNLENLINLEQIDIYKTTDLNELILILNISEFYSKNNNKKAEKYFNILFRKNLKNFKYINKNILQNIQWTIMYNLGYIALKNKELEKAEYFFKNILNNAPTKNKKYSQNNIYLNSFQNYNKDYNIISAKNLIQIYNQKKDLKKALNVYEKYIKLKYENIEFDNIKYDNMKNQNIEDLIEYITDKLEIIKLSNKISKNKNITKNINETVKIYKNLYLNIKNSSKKNSIDYEMSKHFEKISYNLSNILYQINDSKNAEEIIKIFSEIYEKLDYKNTKINSLIKTLEIKKTNYNILDYEYSKNFISSLNIENNEDIKKLIIFITDYLKVFKNNFYLKSEITLNSKKTKYKLLAEIESDQNFVKINLYFNKIFIGKITLDKNNLSISLDQNLKTLIALFNIKFNIDNINNKIKLFTNNFLSESYILDFTKTDNIFIYNSENKNLNIIKPSKESLDIYFDSKNFIDRIEIDKKTKIYFDKYNSILIIKKIENEDNYIELNKILDFKLI